MDLTLDQVSGLAPDAGSAAAGKKLSSASHWQDLGCDERALWGQCKGSALYQVRVDLTDLASRCSCPSRKFPCKHALGLMMLAAQEPKVLAPSNPPEWVVDWLAKRASKAAAKPANDRAPDPVAQAKRAEKRENRVGEGVDRLNLWLADLVRNGLAGLESAAPRFWHEPAARLIDAQAPGLAARVSRLGTIPGSSRDWPSRLLDDLGRLRLLVHAYGRLDALDPDMQAEVRQLVGWTVSQDELDATGERVTDDWTVFGQRVNEEERLRVQHSWLVGRGTGRMALVVQFAAGTAPFPEAIISTTHMTAELIFYPGTFRQRARIRSRLSEPATAVGPLPSVPSVRAFLEDVADALARQPWIDRFGCVLSNIAPTRANGTWYARDESGDGLPLSGDDPWLMLALSGGRPFQLAGEWDGHRLRPMIMVVDGFHFVL